MFKEHLVISADSCERSIIQKWINEKINVMNEMEKHMLK